MTLRTSPPGEAIVDVATSEAVDLVVVGSHGRGSMGRLLIGIVSDHVVRHAPCPVLVGTVGGGGQVGRQQDSSDARGSRHRDRSGGGGRLASHATMVRPPCRSRGVTSGTKRAGHRA